MKAAFIERPGPPESIQYGLEKPVLRSSDAMSQALVIQGCEALHNLGSLRLICTSMVRLNVVSGSRDAIGDALARARDSGAVPSSGRPA